jgi:hypothetical protein
MGEDDLAALHGRALKLEAELDEVVRDNDRLRIDLGAPSPGQQSALIATTLVVILGVLAAIYVGVSVSAHRRAMVEADLAGGELL